MSRKPYRQRERRYVPEFVEKRYPTRTSVFYNFAVGPPPEEMQKAFPTVPLAHFRRWRFWVDALVIWQGRIIVIEGKLRKPLEGLGQLLFYKELLDDTPELAPYRNYPVDMVLVVPREDPRVITFAQRVGISIEIFSPDWVNDYLKSIGYA